MPPAKRPAVVYLDTQDYSRMADATVGRADARLNDLLDELVSLKDQGLVRFAYSAPIVSELFQYNQPERDLTMRKAKVIQRLCDGCAFIHPIRLVSLEMARVAQANGLLATRPRLEAVSDEDGWPPSIEGVLVGMRKRIKALIREAVTEQTAGVPGMNRANRRQFEAHMRGQRFSARAAEFADEFVEKWPISRKFAEEVLPKVFDGKLGEHEASRLLLREFAEPEKFVVIYFERYEGVKDLPDWMRTFGVNLNDSVNRMRSDIAPMLELPEGDKLYRTLLAKAAPGMAKSIAMFAQEGGEEFGFGPGLVERFRDDETLMAQVPAYQLLTSLIVEYFDQNSGLRTKGRTPRPSDGGDMIHALYAAHCDFWRSDGYFANLVKPHVPPGSATIVPKLESLPDLIRAHGQAVAS
jgi:hypothetical protein